VQLQNSTPHIRAQMHMVMVYGPIAEVENAGPFKRVNNLQTVFFFCRSQQVQYPGHLNMSEN